MVDSRLMDIQSERLPAGEGRADSALWRLPVEGRTFFVLRQRGTFPDIAYDHGRLLAREIDQGVFPEIVSTIRRGIDQENRLLERLCAVVYACFNKRMRANVSPEFRDAAEALAQGYLAGGGGSSFDAADVQEVVFSIEIGNLIAGLLHRLGMPATRLYTGALLALQCLPYVLDRDAARSLRVLGTAAVSPAALGRAMRQAGRPRNRVGYGCTAFAAGAAQTADGCHIHARNLDGEMYAWNAAPVLFLIDETAGRPGWRKYVACGTAGLIYPGGISGINDAGLAVSLHQMSTARYHSGFLFGSGDIAPFVQQRVLREAATLDEAVDLVRSLSHFAAWTIFCSHAATGKAVRIELNGSRVRVIRSDDAMAQANHFLHPDMMERAFDASDGHFTPTFGKWLETRARLSLLQDGLARGVRERVIDVDWAIERLASHEDWALRRLCGDADQDGAAWRRSFGRTPSKAYGQLMSIARGDPDRARRRDEIWMTLGERRPASHATLLGWRIDWSDLSVTPVGERPGRRVAAAVRTPAWEQALHHYVEACVAATRPRDGNGDYLNRDPSEEEQRRDRRIAIARLDQAIALAQADGIEEVPFLYMRARLLSAVGDDVAALSDWERLIGLWEEQKRGRPGGGALRASLIHPYEAALILILSCAAADRARGSRDWVGRAGRIAEARALLRQVRAEYFPGGRPAHPDLAAWEERLARIESGGGGAVEAPEENFITVE